MELVVNIKKKLRNFTLAVNFTAHDEVFALLGASGCGKSMTLKCIAGIERPDSGRIVLNGRVLFDSDKNINLKPQKRHIGYLFQNYALFPNMTIAENIRFVASGTAEEKNAKVSKNLARFSLTELENSYPHELSGGQQQRAAFARILAADTELLLLDEPFSALDSYLKWQLELELAAVLKSYDNSSLLVSHDRGEVFRLADRIAVINKGEMEAVHTKHGLFASPDTLAATLLSGCKNVSAAKKIAVDKILAAEWGIELTTIKEPSEATKYVGIRAHFLEPKAARENSDNVFLMKVDHVIEDTFSYLIMVRFGDKGKLIRYELGKKEWEKIKADELYLYFPPDKLMLMNR